MPEPTPAQKFKIVHDLDGDTTTECPHCGALGAIVEVDEAVRFNELVFDGDDPLRPRANMGDSGDWDFARWYCTSCGSDELATPAGLSIRDWS